MESARRKRLNKHAVMFRDCVSPKDILPHLTCIPKSVKESIICKEDNEGASRAAFKFSLEVFKYDNWFAQLIPALRQEGHNELADLLDDPHDFRGDRHGDHQGDHHGDHQGDHRGNHQGDRQGDRQGDHQGDRQGDHRGNHQGDRQDDRRVDRQGDRQGDHRGDRQGDHRDDRQGDHRGNQQGNHQGDYQGDRQGDCQSDRHEDRLHDHQGKKGYTASDFSPHQPKSRMESTRSLSRPTTANHSTTADKKQKVTGETPCKHLSALVLQKLRCLDVPRPVRGSDWKGLAGQLGKSLYFVQRLASQDSPTEALLNEWCDEEDATLGTLLEALRAIHRDDIRQILEDMLDFHPEAEAKVKIATTGQTESTSQFKTESSSRQVPPPTTTPSPSENEQPGPAGNSQPSNLTPKQLGNDGDTAKVVMHRPIESASSEQQRDNSMASCSRNSNSEFITEGSIKDENPNNRSDKAEKFARELSSENINTASGSDMAVNNLNSNRLATDKNVTGPVNVNCTGKTLTSTSTTSNNNLDSGLMPQVNESMDKDINLDISLPSADTVVEEKEDDQSKLSKCTPEKPGEDSDITKKAKETASGRSDNSLGSCSRNSKSITGKTLMSHPSTAFTCSHNCQMHQVTDPDDYIGPLRTDDSIDKDINLEFSEASFPINATVEGKEDVTECQSVRNAKPPITSPDRPPHTSLNRSPVPSHDRPPNTMPTSSTTPISSATPTSVATPIFHTTPSSSALGTPMTATSENQLMNHTHGTLYHNEVQRSSKLSKCTPEKPGEDSDISKKAKETASGRSDNSLGSCSRNSESITGKTLMSHPSAEFTSSHNNLDLCQMHQFTGPDGTGTLRTDDSRDRDTNLQMSDASFPSATVEGKEDITECQPVSNAKPPITLPDRPPNTMPTSSATLISSATPTSVATPSSSAIGTPMTATSENQLMNHTHGTVYHNEVQRSFKGTPVQQPTGMTTDLPNVCHTPSVDGTFSEDSLMVATTLYPRTTNMVPSPSNIQQSAGGTQHNPLDTQSQSSPVQVSTQSPLPSAQKGDYSAADDPSATQEPQEEAAHQESQENAAHEPEEQEEVASPGPQGQSVVGALARAVPAFISFAAAVTRGDFFSDAS